MGQALKRIERRKKAITKLSELMARPDKVIVIHYSCESFYNRPNGTSPRVTSIAVRPLQNSQTTSFSIHKIAEIKGIQIDCIEQHYDDLEKQMLEEFYKYVKGHNDCTWLHWNMRDANYGFPALSHRFKVLKGKPEDLKEDVLVDLSSLLVDIYGPKYVEDPHLAKLRERNKISNKDFLDGAAEAEAFNKKEYVKLHQSTLRKVNIIATIASYASEGSLKTNAKKRDIYGNNLVAIGEFLREHWIASIILFIIAVASLIVGIIPLLH